MKALVYRRNGAAQDVLEMTELDVQQPRAGQVRVRVAYSGVNPSDVKARADVAGTGMPYSFVVPHQDGSGVVVQVGAGVDTAWLGKRVWFFHAQLGRQFGSAAEYACLPVEQVAPLPDEVSLEVGASVGIPLMTAYRVVHGYGDISGKTVLVAGGAGNVGLYAIQLARRAGARVIATVSGASRDKARLAAEAGAELVLDYRSPELLQAGVIGATQGRGVDVIIEVNAAQNAHHYPQLLAMHGRVIVYGSQAAEIPLSYRGLMKVMGSVHFFLIYQLSPSELAATAQAVNALLAEQVLRHQPHMVFAPEEASLAHQHVEAGRLGKAMLRWI